MPSYEVRPELTMVTTFGTVPVSDKLVELHGGRLVNSIETPRMEFAEIMYLADVKASANTLLTDDLRLIPAPRQLARIVFFAELGCWDLPTYAGTRGGGAYGRMQVPELRETNSLAHRTMYRVFFGVDSLPNGSADFLDHICERKSCCYPRHLERVTHQENTRRGGSRSDPNHPWLDL